MDLKGNNIWTIVGHFVGHIRSIKLTVDLPKNLLNNLLNLIDLKGLNYKICGVAKRDEFNDHSLTFGGLYNRGKN